MPPRLAFVTAADTHHIRPEDHALVEAVRDAGISVNLVPWDDPNVVWEGYDSLHMRLCSGYYQQPADFRKWLALREKSGIPMTNPACIIRWNMDKRYLRDMAQRNIAIPETLWLTKDSAPALTDLTGSRHWQAVVGKPAVSAGAYLTFKAEAPFNAAAQSQLYNALQHSDVLLQPYLHNITTEGEWSVHFIAGKPAHTILKKAKKNDYRVQDVHGGSYEQRKPPEDLLTFSCDAINAAQQICGTELLYARVDAVRDDEGWLLMELEAIEPAFYFDVSQEAFKCFRDALVQSVQQPFRA